MVFESQQDVSSAFNAGLLIKDCVIVRCQGLHANGIQKLKINAAVER